MSFKNVIKAFVNLQNSEWHHIWMGNNLDTETHNCVQKSFIIIKTYISYIYRKLATLAQTKNYSVE